MVDVQPAPPDTPAAPEPVPTVGPGRAALSGAVAALGALAAGELVTSLTGRGQSLVASVGTAFIDRFAASLKDLAISVFGTNDKAALIVGIVVVSALVGAGLGLAARCRLWVADAGFVAFGLVGVLATVTDVQASEVVGVMAAVAAVAAGAALLRLLLRTAATGRPVVTTRTVEYPTNPAATRRAFFGWVGAVGAGAAVVATAAKSLSGRSAAEEARRSVQLPRVPGSPDTTVPSGEAPLGVPGLSPYHVPNEDFYLIDTALVKPQVDPASWSLQVTGHVERPFELSFEELLALPMVEESVTLSCVSNEVGGSLVGNARWQGVRLTDLLERAGVKPEGTQIVGVSTDGWTAGFPTAAALDGRTALVAVGMNGEPLPIAHGFPARLVVSGLYGYVSATKWLREIRLTRLEEFDGYWIDKGWSKQAPVKTQSRIDVPESYGRLRAGPAKIAGVAWAPDTGIAMVEVQVDDGPWRPATLGSVVSKDTWVQWVLDWDAPAGDHQIRCRATDLTGATQTEDQRRPDPDGATGWHRVRVTVNA